MGEADVREDVLAPWLSRLGYSNFEGSGTKIVREQRLEYPWICLGRKKPGRDRMVVGIADYTLEVEQHARWTLEAKAPNVSLDADVIQQAWSYAAHPEVRGVYFVVSNGRESRLYVTSAPAESALLLEWRYDETEQRWSEIFGFLSPAAIARRFPNFLYRAGKPLSPGLTAFEHVSSGMISYQGSSLGVPLLEQMQVAIVAGGVFRNESGHVAVWVETRGPFREFDKTIRRLGLERQIYISDAEILSTDPMRPTRLVFRDEQLLPVALHPETFRAVDLVAPVQVRIEAVASCVVRDYRLFGPFELSIEYVTSDGVVPAQAQGTFDVQLR